MFPMQQAPQSKIILEYRNKTEGRNKLHNSSDNLLNSSSNEREAVEDIVENNNYKKILSSQLKNQLSTTTTAPMTVPTTIEQEIVEDIIVEGDNGNSSKQVTANTDSNTSSSRIGSNHNSAKSSPNITTASHSVDVDEHCDNNHHPNNSNNAMLASSIDEKSNDGGTNQNGTATDSDYNDTTQYYYQYLNKKEKALLKKLRHDIKILNERAYKLAEQMDECTSETKKDKIKKELSEEVDSLMCAEAKLERLTAPKCIYDIWDSDYRQRHEDTGDYMNLSYYSDNTVYYDKGNDTAPIEIKNPDIKTGHGFWKLINSMRAECEEKQEEGKEYYFENYLLEHNLITKEDLAKKSPTGDEAREHCMARSIIDKYCRDI